jgi:hypothetical protein
MTTGSGAHDVSPTPASTEGGAEGAASHSSRGEGWFSPAAIEQHLGYRDDCWELSALACPRCQRIYLHEADMGEVWLDPHDLTQTVSVSSLEPFTCAGCGQVIYLDGRGRVLYPQADGNLGASCAPSREVVAASPWAWALGPSQLAWL